MPLGMRFLKDFDGFWKAKWKQVGIQMASKNDANFERRIIQKTLCSLRENQYFEGSGG